MIPNPDYFEDKHPYKMMPIVSVTLCNAVVICISVHFYALFLLL